MKFTVAKDETGSNMDIVILHEGFTGQRGPCVLIAVTKDEALQLATAILQAHQDLTEETSTHR